MINDYDRLVFHFDGNRGDFDDVAAMPLASAMIKAAGIEAKTDFFYNNNILRPNASLGSRVALMREAADFAEKLGINTHDYEGNIQKTTNELTKIFNSGDKILSLEGGPMEAVYRALVQTAPNNLSNITLVSHSQSNEKTTYKNSHDWKDLKREFPQVNFINIENQNNGTNNNKGFNSKLWTWLDNTNNHVLAEARALMQNAQHKVNDPSDVGMLFYALTGNETGNPNDAKAYFNINPPTFDNDNNGGNNNSNDVIVIEAENTKLAGDWETVKDGVVYTGPNSFGSIPEGQTLSYELEVDESGDYYFAVRSARDRSLMSKFRNDLGNDIFFSIEESDTGKEVVAPIKLFTALGSSNLEYRWGTKFDPKGAKHRDATAFLQAGIDYTLNLTGRSEGFIIDKVTVNKGSFFTQNTPGSSTPDPIEPTPDPIEPTPDPPTTPIDPIPPKTTIYGTKRDDLIIGTKADELIYGVNKNSTGKGDLDTLIGGKGADIFVVGTTDKVFYNDSKMLANGDNDYALILDFNPKEGDRIMLGNTEQYNTKELFPNFQGIYYQDELVAVVANSQEINSEYLI